ncbi:uncharacterized protein V6R79_021334 [Siganus canaliculatus]
MSAGRRRKKTLQRPLPRAARAAPPPRSFTLKLLLHPQAAASPSNCCFTLKPSNCCFTIKLLLHPQTAASPSNHQAAADSNH